jgi:osmotically-inducible protein OsmY
MSDVRVEVMNALFWNLAIPRYRVTVEEDRGFVVLHGTVARGSQSACAEANARLVTGVLSVLNQIAVSAE